MQNMIDLSFQYAIMRFFPGLPCFICCLFKYFLRTELEEYEDLIHHATLTKRVLKLPDNL